jgi:hypothetical protein
MEPKWSREEKAWIKHAAKEAGPHSRTYSKKERKRRAEWMRGLRKRTIEKKQHEREMAKQKIAIILSDDQTKNI